MNLDSLVGQTLDEKYLIERELGRGGMGAVYLSTHVGTERPVAVKVIVPQFMQRAEFVERFRREARAAGRLRHPNVVDVTDFGFADTPEGRVAYLVMEYLDGCTLGEILDEEKRLPLAWTLDILEQVSSAIQEAHNQGIIHRDLKPDNIWLEPNQRGGYTVKVLDFGIAKLETTAALPPLPLPASDRRGEVPAASDSPARKTLSFSANQTLSGDESQTETLAENNGGATQAGDRQTIADLKNSNTVASEAGTLIQQSAAVLASATATPSSEKETAIIDSEAGTAILAPAPAGASPTVKQPGTAAAGTRLADGQVDTGGNAGLDKKKTADLTRVGAVLGTPLYMSPEQCRGERLTPQSDIYSLGVIAYQMLSGKTPFEGDYLEVMRAHRELPPPPLDAKKVPRGVKKVIYAAMEKDPAVRPPTAEAFASSLRAYSEGIGTLFQRAMVIYSEHLPKFLTLALLIYSPLAVVTLLLIVVFFMDATGTGFGDLGNGVLKAILVVASASMNFLATYLILGTTAWMVSQILAAPLRPVSVKTAFKEVFKKWRALATTGFLTGILTLLAYIPCLVLGIYFSVVWTLVAPIVVMEGLRGRTALRRSKTLVKRSLRTATAAVFTMFFVPILAASLVAFVANGTVKSFSSNSSDPPPAAAETQEPGQKENDKAAAAEEGGVSPAEPSPTAAENKPEGRGGLKIKINGEEVGIEGGKADKKDMKDHLQETVQEGLTQILMLPLSIFISSFSAIIVALLYLKTRQAGGESMQELLAQFEEADQPESNWQRRVRERLIQSGRMTSKGSSSTGGNSGGGGGGVQRDNISGQRNPAR